MQDFKALKSEEEIIREQVSKLSDEKRKKFHQECSEKLKDSDTYAALAWSLPIGLHHFYLNNWKRAFADIGAVFFGLILIIFLEMYIIGIATILIVLALELNSLFRSEFMVLRYNILLMRSIISRL